MALFPVASVSAGGSSRTCPTTHLTKSPTSSSWSKSRDWPQPLLPSPLLLCSSCSPPIHLHPPDQSQARPISLVCSPFPDWPEDQVICCPSPKSQLRISEGRSKMTIRKRKNKIKNQSGPPFCLYNKCHVQRKHFATWKIHSLQS